MERTNLTKSLQSVKYVYYYLGFTAAGAFCCHKIAGAVQ